MFLPLFPLHWNEFFPNIYFRNSIVEFIQGFLYFFVVLININFFIVVDGFCYSFLDLALHCSTFFASILFKFNFPALNSIKHRFCLLLLLLLKLTIPFDYLLFLVNPFSIFHLLKSLVKLLKFFIIYTLWTTFCQCYTICALPRKRFWFFHSSNRDSVTHWKILLSFLFLDLGMISVFSFQTFLVFLINNLIM